MRGSLRLSILLVPLLALGCGRSTHSDSMPASTSAGTASGVGAGGDESPGTGGRADRGPVSAVDLDGAPIYTRVQRLTLPQWQRAVTDLLRLETPPSIEGFAAPIAGISDFTNNERLLSVDPRAAQDFESGSEAVAALATGSAEALARLYQGTDSAGFVKSFGRRAFRRPLTAEQQQKYEAVFAQGETLYGAGFANGAALVIRAMFQSPYFLYRSELGAAGEPLDDYEAASKLSFWLLGTTPDDALLDAAEAGKLDSADALERFAREMLERPGALEVMRDFHGQAYRLGLYAQLEKLDVPEFVPDVRVEAEEVSYRFFDRIFSEGQGLREILTSEHAFVGPELAPFYGLRAPSGIEERTLDESRLGYFLQVPFLMLFSGNREPNAIERGEELDRDVLCHRLEPGQVVIPPLPPLKPNQTRRQRIEELTAGCGGDCHHVFINPLGFAFESFDGVGQWQDIDQGQRIDTSGSYPFSDGTRSFAGAQELMQILADTEQAHTCYAKKVAGYALQRDIVEADRPLLEQLSSVSRTESLKRMIIELVRSPTFRLRAEGTP